MSAERLPPPPEYLAAMRAFLTDCGFDDAQVEAMMVGDPSPNQVIFSAVSFIAMRVRRIEEYIASEIIRRATSRIITPSDLQ